MAGPRDKSQERSLEWIAWSPRGDLYAVAWRPGETTAAASLELQIHAAADGSRHGQVSLPWGEHRHESEHRWMERGDCIVILLHSPLRASPNEVANVISSTGEVLQIVQTVSWRRQEACSPDGEFMLMYGDGGQVWLAPTIFSLTHLRSGKQVSDQKIRMHSAAKFAKLHVWSQDSKCSYLSHGTMRTAQRSIAQLHGADSASKSRCSFPKVVGLKWLKDYKLSFSPFWQLLVASVKAQHRHAHGSWQLVHWNCCQTGMPATFNTVFSGPDGPYPFDWESQQPCVAP